MKRSSFVKGMTLSGLCLLVLALGFGFSYAVTGANIQAGTSSRLNLSASTSGTLYNAQAGNVTEIDISGKSVTSHWAGFFGNISGNLTLEDSSGKVFYDWAGLGVPKGTVLASNSSTVDWTDVSCADAAVFAGIDASLSMTGASTDRVQNTYSTVTHPPLSVAGTSITADTCNATNAYSNGARNATLFNQILLKDGLDNPLYTTVINASRTSFQGAPVDFQLLVGAKPTGVTPIYFFIELQ